MKKAFVLVSALLLASCASTQDRPKEEAVEISQDCVHWTTANSLPQNGFYKSKDSISFIDYPNRAYAIFDQGGGAPAIFDFSESGWLHMSSDVWIQSTPAKIEHSGDKLGDLMVQLTAVARQNLATSQWAVLLGQAQYVATFKDKTCSLAPQARGAACKTDGSCSLAPGSLDKPGLAKACLKELGFLEGKLRSSFEKTCSHYLTPEFRVRLADIASRSRTCPSIEAPGVQRSYAALCQNTDAFFTKLLH